MIDVNMVLIAPGTLKMTHWHILKVPMVVKPAIFRLRLEMLSSHATMIAPVLATWY